MRKLIYFLSLVPCSFGLLNSIFTRKTILDINLDRKFKNETYFEEFDITIAKRKTMSKTKLSPLFVIPGVDMSGLSVFPNLLRTGLNRDVYILLAGYKKKQHIKNIVSCTEIYIKNNNITKIDILGESFGGVVAVYLCQVLNEIVKSVVLFNPAFNYKHSSICKYINSKDFNKKTLSRFILKNGPNFSALIMSFLKFYYYFPCYIQFYIYSHLLMVINMMITDEYDIINRLNNYFSININDIYMTCKNIHIPVKVIISKNDNILKCDCSQIQNISNFSIIEIENGAHLISFSEVDLNKLL